jgi:hypothetical protein
LLSLNLKVQIQILDLKAYSMPMLGTQGRGSLQQGNHSQIRRFNTNAQHKHHSRTLDPHIGYVVSQTEGCNL